MKTISVSVSTTNGTARMTPKQRASVEELLQTEGVVGLDILKDALLELTDIYNEGVAQLVAGELDCYKQISIH